MSTTPESCRSEEGITVGLVDAVIGIVRVLAPRDLSTHPVQEALADLFEDPDFRTVREARKTAALAGSEPTASEYPELKPGINHLRFPDGAEDYQYECSGGAGCAGWATSGHKTAASAIATYEQHVRESHRG